MLRSIVNPRRLLYVLLPVLLITMLFLWHLHKAGVEKDLLNAAAVGDTRTLRELLKKGVDPNAEWEGKSPLHLAASKGFKDIVELLISSGANIDADSGYAGTPLQHALKFDHPEVAGLLIEEGANLRITNRRGETPLSMAVEIGNEQIVKLMLKKSPKMAKEQYNHDILYNAIKNGLTETFPLLVVKGTNVNIRFDEEKNYVYVGRSGSKKMPEHIAKLYRNTPLHVATREGHTEIAAYLISLGAEVNTRCAEYQKSPLHLAAEKNHIGMVKLLLSHGANANTTDHWKYRPIHLALKEGHNDMVDLLLKSGTKVTAEIAAATGNIKNVKKWIENRQTVLQNLPIWKSLLDCTPVHLEIDVIQLIVTNRIDRFPAWETILDWAVIGGQKEIVELLVENGMEVHPKLPLLEYTIHHAAYNGHADIAEFLISKGADVNCKTILLEETPLLYAAKKGQTDTARVLINNGAYIDWSDVNGDTALNTATKYGEIEMAKLLLSKGADPNLADRNGDAPLDTTIDCYLSPESKQIQIAELLIAYGANIDKRYPQNSTPLHSALWRGSNDIARLFINKGADIEVATDSGETPLHHACHSTNPDVEIVEFLIDKGADINVKDNCGKTPLHHAAACGNREIVQLLIEKGANVNAKDNEDKKPMQVLEQRQRSIKRFYWYIRRRRTP